MSTPNSNEERIDAIIADYLRDVAAGTAPERQHILLAYPDLAAELQTFFADHDRMHRFVEPATLGPDRRDEPGGSLGLIRYFGDYELIEEIARGGMGVVYKARQLSLNRMVALKMILAGQLADSTDVERFRHEAQTAAGLQHANIVAIHEVGEHFGQHYFSMDFIAGRNLAEMLRDGPLPADRAAKYVRIIADAIDFAHQRGTLHRDVKPTNVLIDEFDQPRVTDFGLAKKLTGESGLTATGAVLGTPSYMSPEQASADRGALSPASDVYSIGALLYHLVTGRPPFQAATTFDTILQVLNEEPAAPRLLNPSISRDLETIILKCLAKDPARRYISARELAHDLECLLAEQPIRARRPTVAERVGRALVRHRKSAMLMGISMAASILAVLLAIAGLRAYQAAHEDEMDLATEGPSLLAEVLHVTDDLVIASGPVPSTKPMVIPHGNYRLRLSSSGLLSETWPFLAPGSIPNRISLRQQWLWPPMEVHPGDRHEPFPVDGRTDLITIQPLDKVIRRIHGGTGWPIWTIEADPAKSPLVDRQAAFAGLRLFTLSLSDFDVVPTTDLNQDGTADVLFKHRNMAAIAAVSGADGRLLWRFDGSMPESANENPGQVDRHGLQVKIGAHIEFDIDEDGTADILVPIIHHVKEPRPHWMQAINGRTGAPLWQRDLSREIQLGSEWDSYGRYRLNYDLQILIRATSPYLGVVADTQAFLLNLKNGANVLPFHSFPVRLEIPPKYFYRQGDSFPGFLFVHRTPHDHPQRASLIIGEFSWKSQLVRWQKQVPLPEKALNSNTESLHGSLELADLDNDDRPEIIYATIDDWFQPGHRGDRSESVVEVLDSSDGHSRWRIRMPRPIRQMQQAVDQLIIGPDIDGDSFREIFTVAHGEDENYESQLQVMAHSGKDGKAMWRRSVQQRLRYSDSLRRPLRWWQTGEDGWPLLVVPVANGPGGQPICYTFSAGTGKMVHTMPEIRDPRVIDLNGDGINDLLYTVYPQGAPRLIALRGQYPEPWRHFGTWQSAADFDGDGFNDLLLSNNSMLRTRSGRTGKPLWGALLYDNHEIPGQGVNYLDINGDGTPDQIALFKEPNNKQNKSGVPTLSLATFSGKDGQKIWQSDDIGISSSTGNTSGRLWRAIFPSAEFSGPDVDGTHKLLVQDYEKVHVVAARTGQLSWRQEKVFGGLADQNEPSLARSVDLNGDGVCDFVWWIRVGDVPSSNNYELQALNGRDGSKLWAEPGLLTRTQLEPINENPSIRNPTAYSPLPYPLIGDLDGDGTAEVVAMRIRYGRAPAENHEIYFLDGWTGKTKWRYSWFAEYMDKTPLPLLLKVRGATKRQFVAVASAVVDKQGLWTGIVLLDPEAKVAFQSKVQPAKQNDAAVPSIWHAADVNADGTDELLFVSEQKLMAMSLTGQYVWQFPLPSSVNQLIEVRSPDEKQNPMVVIWSGRDVFGIDGPTGQLKWRCEVATQPRYDRSQMVRLLAANDPSGLPRVVLTSGNHWYTVVQQPWRTDAAGKCLPVPAPPITMAAVDLDPLRKRPLPWANQLRNVMNMGGIEFVIAGAFLLILALTMWFRFWRMVFWFIASTLVVSGIMAGYFLFEDAKHLAPDDHYLWSDWWQILLPGAWVTFWLMALVLIVYSVAKIVRIKGNLHTSVRHDNCAR